MNAPGGFRFFDLEGKTLLITGVTRGIGRALLPGLLGQGLNLILISRGAEAVREACREAGADPARAALFECDLADPAAVEATASKIEAAGLPVDAMLHNAAIDPRHPFASENTAFWQNLFQVNLFSAVELTRRLLPAVRKSPQGRVIFTGSVLDALGGGFLTAYSASKGALSALTRALAHELQGTGITVNCIVPGAIRVEKAIETPEGNERLIAWQSIGRRLDPADLLGLLCLLLSQAGGAITAQSITVDGGLLHPITSPVFQGRNVKE